MFKELVQDRYQILAAELKINERQVANAVSENSFGWAEMHPNDFLLLTTDDAVDLATIKNSAKEVEFYNRAGSIIHPFIGFDLKTGKLDGHEGRHRAAAVLKSGGTSLPVALYARYDGKYRPDVEPRHLPRVLKGQFSGVSVPVSKFIRSYKPWETGEAKFVKERYKTDLEHGFRKPLPEGPGG